MLCKPTRLPPVLPVGELSKLNWQESPDPTQQLYHYFLQSTSPSWTRQLVFTPASQPYSVGLLSGACVHPQPHCATPGPYTLCHSLSGSPPTFGLT